MFDWEELRAILALMAHPAFQGAVAMLALIVAIIGTIIGKL